MVNRLSLIIAVSLLISCAEKKSDKTDAKELALEQVIERHRPEFHFSPDSMWMNDPNGMVFDKGIYHLFYQYYPDSTVWGPMHWGHATSSNMITWEHQPIALYPDELGYIFSGSAVLDENNTTGFGMEDNPPLVAIYTYHDPVAAKENPSMSQSQGIAYSLDDGKTWKKYENNPVLESPGINDFRDPKVRWYEPTKRWIMTLAVKDQGSALRIAQNSSVSRDISNRPAGDHRLDRRRSGGDARGEEEGEGEEEQERANHEVQVGERGRWRWEWVRGGGGSGEESED